MKKRVLMVVSQLATGGVEMVVANLQQHLDKDRFDCIICTEYQWVSPMEKELVSQGVEVIHRDEASMNLLSDYRKLKKIMQEGHYDVVHSHVTFYSGLVMRVAKSAGIKVRVSHAHATKVVKEKSHSNAFLYRMYTWLMRRWLNRYSTDIIGCSRVAGNFVFGEKQFQKRGIVLNNGIDLAKYQFNQEIRTEVQREFHMEGKTVVGHVGTLNYVKNHDFLLDVFYEYQKQNSDSVLLLVGNNPDNAGRKEMIIEKAQRLGILDKVIFTGLRSDVNRLLMGMDIMVFPSFHEGLPVSLVEAQATKLPCLIANTVTADAKLNDNVEFLSLEQSPKAWVDKMIPLLQRDRATESNDTVLREYDILQVTQKLGNIYLRGL